MAIVMHTLSDGQWGQTVREEFEIGDDILVEAPERGWQRYDRSPGTLYQSDCILTRQDIDHLVVVFFKDVNRFGTPEFRREFLVVTQIGAIPEFFCLKSVTDLVDLLTRLRLL